MHYDESFSFGVDGIPVRRADGEGRTRHGRARLAILRPPKTGNFQSVPKLQVTRDGAKTLCTCIRRDLRRVRIFGRLTRWHSRPRPLRCSAVSLAARNDGSSSHSHRLNPPNSPHELSTWPIFFAASRWESRRISRPAWARKSCRWTM
jgi:hypothetical protein